MMRTVTALLLTMVACDPAQQPPMQPTTDVPSAHDAGNTSAPDTSPAMPAPSGPDGCYALGEGTTAMDQMEARMENPNATFECCEGLDKVDTFEWPYLADEKCIISKGGRWVCVECGDGSCGEGENLCNCPDDCLPPS